MIKNDSKYQLQENNLVHTKSHKRVIILINDWNRDLLEILILERDCKPKVE